MANTKKIKLFEDFLASLQEEDDTGDTTDSTQSFEDLLASFQKEDDIGNASKAFTSLLQSAAGTAIANRLNPAEIEIPEPDNYDALISGAYSQTKGGAIPFSDLQKYRNYFQGAGIRSPQDITAFITQDIIAKPGNVAGLTQDDYRKKMASYYGQENVNPETGMYTGTYGRGLGKIQGRPNYA